MSILEKLNNSIGHKFGRLTIIGFGGYQEVVRPDGYISKFPMAHVKCECGDEKNVLFANISKRVTTSCGCYQREMQSKKRYKHGHNSKNSKEYRAWKNMIVRCCNPNFKDFDLYGGRGIKICPQWRNSDSGFLTFLKDIGYAPSPKHSLDRLDSNGDYEPQNCRWATILEQANNQRRTIKLIHGGQIKAVSNIEREFGFAKGTIRARLKRGWSKEEAVNPKKKYSQ